MEVVLKQFLSITMAVALAATPLLDAASSAAVIKNANAYPTATPIKHLVIIFQENVSFDHYFGTYPNALNPANEFRFTPLPNTPTVNGLAGGLLTNNPNLNPANGSGATNPFRLDRSQSATADQDHDYTPEQMAFDGGLMDLFPLSVGTAGPPPSAPPAAVTTNGLTMGYYDGNTVTAMWNFAQHFAMSDNSYDTNFGPSTVGAINLISGQTNGVVDLVNGPGPTVDGGNGSLTLIGDADPVGDVCSTSGSQFLMSGKNVGDLLNAANISWGFFEGGFNLSLVNANGTTGCARSTTSVVTGSAKADYIPHHQPFQYYASTANPTHARPTSQAMVGHQDAANHQYDTHDFFTAVSAGNFPAVSFLKAPGFQDGHAGYSDPLDEQQFVAATLNFLQAQPDWSSTAVVIAYDDSDGWYDHQIGPLLNQSATSADALLGPGNCGAGTVALPGVNPANTHAQGRCGYGPRLPFLVISPFSRSNFVDHTVTDQTSPLRFIEDNWLSGTRIGNGSFDALANSITQMLDFTKAPNSKLVLDENTGAVVGSH
jgi:phospholipase C